MNLLSTKSQALFVFLYNYYIAEAEALILWPPPGKSDSLEKTLMLGKTEGRRRRG